MNSKNTTHTFAIAFTVLFMMVVGSSAVPGQDNEKGNDVVGIWEAVNVPAENDCATGQPIPETPIIKVLNTFNQGGTGWIEDTAPFDGPYRSTGASIWKHTSGRNYTYLNVHYTFDPDKTYRLTIRQRSKLTLSKDGNTFTENGTFDVIIPDGTVVYSGCFSAESHRLTF